MRFCDATAVKFLVVGGANTFAGLAVIYLAKWLWGIGDVTANVLGYSVGLALSFTLNKSWTFRHEGRSGPAFARFVVVFAAAYAANLATVVALADGWHVNGYVAQAIGIVPYTAVGYLASRNYVFR